MIVGAPKIIRPGVTAKAGVVGPRGLPGQDGKPGAPGGVGPAAYYPTALWQTSTQYLSGPPAHVVTIGGSSFVCAGAHISGIFATDFANGYWQPWASKGDTGTPGSVWYSGAGVPASTVGVNGDYFFRTDNSDVLLKTAGAWAVIANINGIAGNTIRTGTGNPSPSIGANGDYYLDNTPGAPVIWGPKAAGAWPSSGTSLVGPTGTGAGSVNTLGSTTSGNVVVFGANPTSIKDGGTLGDAAFKNTGTTAGTLAAGDDSRIVNAASALSVASLASDVSLSVQNILYQGLLLAAQRNVPTGLVDGIADPFSSLADINTGASSGYTFNAGPGTIGATPGGYVAPFTTVSTSAQAISDGSYDGSSGRTADKPFAASPSAWASPGGSTSGSPPAAYIGQDFGAGNTPTIARVLLIQGPQSDYTVTSVIAKVADSPAGPWTTVGTFSVPTGTAQQTLTIANPQARRCFALFANSDVANSLHLWMVGALQFQTGTAQSPANMVLQSATLPINVPGLTSPSAMRVLVQVDSTSAALTANTDLLAFLSRDGATFTQGTLSLVQQMPDGTSIYDTGWTSVSGQPAGNSTMTYKVTTPTGKAIVLTGVAMLVKP